jgi:hypothetical protein
MKLNQTAVSLGTLENVSAVKNGFRPYVAARLLAPAVNAAGNAVAISAFEHMNSVFRPDALEKASTPYGMIGSWRLLLKRRSGPPFLFT